MTVKTYFEWNNISELTHFLMFKRGFEANCVFG